MNYTIIPDIKSGHISMCGEIPIDEIPQAIESLKSEYERAKAIMGNPLSLNIIDIDIAMTNYYALVGNNEFVAPSHLAMIHFYQNTLVMLRELESDLHVTADSVEVCASGPDKEELLADADRLRVWRDKIAAILEAHKQHMPEE